MILSRARWWFEVRNFSLKVLDVKGANSNSALIIERKVSIRLKRGKKHRKTNLKEEEWGRATARQDSGAAQSKWRGD